MKVGRIFDIFSPSFGSPSRARSYNSPHAQASTQRGFTVANEPHGSFKFRFKIGGMHTHCMRENTLSRSITAVFHHHRSHSMFQLAKACKQIVTERARPCSLRGQGRSFGCKTGCSQFLFEFDVPLHDQSFSNKTVRDLHGALTKGRASEANLFSLQNEEHRVQSHPFSRCLASIWNGEGIIESPGTVLPRLIDIVVVQRQEDVRQLRTVRPPLMLSGS